MVNNSILDSDDHDDDDDDDDDDDGKYGDVDVDNYGESVYYDDVDEK